MLNQVKLSLLQISQLNLLRWKQYGAPYDPVPEHHHLNSLLAEISNHPTVQTMEVRQVPKEWSMELRLNKEEKDDLATIIDDPSEETGGIPMFWGTQQEVKETLKEKQNMHEHKVIESIDARKNLASSSCRIYLEWGLTRELAKKILRSFSYDRMLQVTLGSILCATRFKALEGQDIIYYKLIK